MLKIPGTVSAFLISGLWIVSSAPAQGAPRQTVVALEPDMITVLRKPPVKDDKTLILQGAELEGEVTSEAVASQRGWRSMRVVLDIACATRNARVQSMHVFADRGAQGAETTLSAPDSWISPSAHTYAWDAIAFLCGPSRQGAALQSAAPKTPLVSPTAPVAPKAAEAEEPAAQAPVHMGLASVQVGSTTVESDAAAIMTKLKATYGAKFAGLQTRIERADVRGQAHFRVIVFGFSSIAAAKSFCSDVRSANGCMVRGGS